MSTARRTRDAHASYPPSDRAPSIAVLVVAGALAACSSDASSTSSSARPAARSRRRRRRCARKLTAASTAVGEAQAGQTGDLQTKAESLASGLNTAAGALKTVGGRAPGRRHHVGRDRPPATWRPPRRRDARQGDGREGQVDAARDVDGVPRLLAGRLGLDPLAPRVVHRRERPRHGVAPSDDVQLPAARWRGTSSVMSSSRSIIASPTAAAERVPVGAVAHLARRARRRGTAARRRRAAARGPSRAPGPCATCARRRRAA